MTDNNGENPVVAERLKRLKPQARQQSRLRKAILPAMMLATGLGAGGYVAVKMQANRPDGQTMPTAEVSEFQDGLGLDGFAVTRAEDAIPVREEAPAPQIEVRTEADPETLAELNDAREELERLRNDLAQARAAEGDTSALDELRLELEAMRSEADLRDQAYDEMMRDNLRLQTELDTASMMAEQDRLAADAEAQRLIALEQRRAEDAVRRAAAEAELEARTQSPMVAYRAGGGTARGGTTEDLPDEDSQSDAEAFRRAAAGRADVTQAEIVADPSRTVIQGTLIEATLSNAISSQLEGNVSATVSYDVWSMDMSNVAIPRGSKIFGRYSSSVDKGQRRILVTWDRLVTPDGQSVVMAAYGTDRIGRSGLTGRVNNHTFGRFAAAAAVSLISAAPSLLAAAVESEEDGEISSDTAENLGQNMSDSVAGMMQDYIDIPTTISIDQGAVVMVLVNTDLEML